MTAFDPPARASFANGATRRGTSNFNVDGKPFSISAYAVSPPAEAKAQQEHVVSQAIEAAFGHFWNRLATEKAHA
jgi:hypothetical protein